MAQLANIQFPAGSSSFANRGDHLAQAIRSGTEAYLSAQEREEKRREKAEQLKLQKQELSIRQDTLAETARRNNLQVLGTLYDSAISLGDTEKAEQFAQLMKITLQSADPEASSGQIRAALAGEMQAARKRKLDGDSKGREVEAAGGQTRLLKHAARLASQRSDLSRRDKEELVMEVVRNPAMTAEQQDQTLVRVRDELDVLESPEFARGQEVREGVSSALAQSVVSPQGRVQTPISAGIAATRQTPIGQLLMPGKVGQFLQESLAGPNVKDLSRIGESFKGIGRFTRGLTSAPESR